MISRTDNEIKKLRDEINFLKTAVRTEKTVTFFDADSVGGEIRRVFKVTALGASHAYVNIKFKLLSLYGDVTVTLNGLKKCVYKPVIGENEIELDCEFKSGENVLEVEYLNYFSFDNFRIGISGFIETKDHSSRLTAMDFGQIYLTVFKNGARKVVTVNRCDGSGESELLNSSDDIFCASKLDGSTFVAVYGDGREMYASVFGTDGSLVTGPEPFVADADAFFPGYSTGGALFYAVEKNRIKKYVFDASLNLTVTDTGESGREIFDDGGKVCVVGFDGRATFKGEI